MNKWAANIQFSFGKSIKLLNKCPFFHPLHIQGAAVQGLMRQ